MHDKWYKVYFYGFLAILALPFITTPALLSPTAWGKVVLFRIILASLIFLFIYQRKEADFSVLRNIASYLLIAYFILLLLSTIFSLDPNFSFWDSPLRGGGFLNYAFYIIFAFLLVLIVKKEDWQKILKFSILIGVLVSFIAIFQQLGLFGKTVISYNGRMPGTIGGPTFLSLYLLLLFFISLSFFLKQKKIIYLLASLLFLYIIIFDGSRAAYFGLLIGFFYFILAGKKNLFKVIFLIALVLMGGLVYYINTTPKLPDYLQENRLTKEVLPRLSVNLASGDPRFSAWFISYQAIKERPFLGYGPENFSIAFDRYYDPSLSEISKEWGSWYDKAHSIIFETAVTSGIPAIIVFLSLIAVLFWKLQKIKYTSDTIMIHGVQATFLAYLSANFFGFDVFSTYIIFFLLVAYSLSLISKRKEVTQETIENKEFNPFKSIVYCLLFIVLLFFIWYAGLKSLYINRDINMADNYVKTNKCQKAVDLMELKVIHNSSVIDSYAKLKYIDIIKQCDKQIPGLKDKSAQKTVETLKEVVKIRPYYTRAWIFLGSYTNLLIGNRDYFSIQNVEELKEESNSYFEKAYQLSPKHEEIFPGWIQLGLMFDEYEFAKEKTDMCLKLNPESSYCWWLRGLSDIYLENYEEAQRDIEMAVERSLSQERKKSIGEILKDTSGFKEPFPDWLEIYLLSPDIFEVRKTAKQCIEESNSSRCWWQRGLANLFIGDIELARRDLKTAMEKGFGGRYKEYLNNHFKNLNI